jgi:hypothetical protein
MKIILAVVAATTLTACGAATTRTYEEIKTINNQQFLCTWTQEPFSLEKKDYRCEAFQVVNP